MWKLGKVEVEKPKQDQGKCIEKDDLHIVYDEY
jgi:hypothetical protein